MFRPALLVVVSLLLVAPAALAKGPVESSPRIAWSLFGPRSRAVYDSAPGNATPHPAVARIIVPENGATAFGSGTLVGVNQDRGLVVTNWHVVRDGTGLVEVVFPSGFRSQAKPLKVDSDWDLAALVIWRPPNVEPVKIATQPPRQGDFLTIHGYGQGQYRIATGRCTNYFSPRIDYPHEMVELDAEARQGDSGGPIFNQSGELAGVLFGAGQGNTLGSFAPRVRHFLATAVPDFEKSTTDAIAVANRTTPAVATAGNTNISATLSSYPSSPWSPPQVANVTKTNASSAAAKSLSENRWGLAHFAESSERNVPVPLSANGFRIGPKPQVELAGVASPAAGQPGDSPHPEAGDWHNLTRNGWYDSLKTLLAVVGLATIALRLVKIIR